MIRVAQSVPSWFHLNAAALAIALILSWSLPAAAQYAAGTLGAATTGNSNVGQTSQLTGSVPSGPATQ